MTVTYPDGSSESVSQYSSTDGATTTLTYTGGVSGYVKISFTATAQSVYVHNIAVKNYGTIATIGATGWATLSSDNILDFSSAIDNLTAAYIVTGATGTAITKTAIDAPIAACQGILLNGSGEVKIPGAATASFDASTNKMVAGTGAAVNYDSNDGYNYVLASNGGVAQFQHIVSETPATVPVGKAYLALKSNLAPWLSIIGDDDDTTDINVVRSETEEVKGVFYDLSGRHVENPTKGIFIVNGKKVLVK